MIYYEIHKYEIIIILYYYTYITVVIKCSILYAIYCYSKYCNRHISIKYKHIFKNVYNNYNITRI